MPQFSRKSSEQLFSCHPDLQAIANEAIKYIDFAVIEGFRNEMRQKQALDSGRSRLAWPNSAHNQMPSRAFDFVPFPVDYSAAKSFYRVVGVIQACAGMLNIKIRLGADFKNFADLGHVELL